jgi:hypothetical protein
MPSAALVLTMLSAGFLAVFWVSPRGVLALRRRAGGALQVDVRAGYSPRTLYGLLEAYGEAGRADFLWMLRLDMLFPAVYASAIWAAADTCSSPAAGWLGAAAAAMDYVENICLIHVVRVYPRRSTGAAVAAGAATSLKFGLIAAALAGLGLAAWRNG